MTAKATKADGGIIQFRPFDDRLAPRGSEVRVSVCPEWPAGRPSRVYTRSFACLLARRGHFSGWSLPREMHHSPFFARCFFAAEFVHRCVGTGPATHAAVD